VQLVKDLLLPAATHERHHSVRIPIAVAIELRVDGTDVPMRIETSDLSVGGCYVEMNLTLAVGTRLDVVLWLDGQKTVAKGNVVTCHPQFGNGIAFTGLAPEASRRLQCFLDRAVQRQIGK
jgi:hypothetical protein